MKSTKDTKTNNIICPICEGTMKQNDYPYDTLKDVKVNYKCDTCGHKSTKIL